MNMQAGGAVTAIKHTGVTIGKEELENARKTLDAYCYSSPSYTAEYCAKEFEGKGFVRLTDVPRLPAEYDALKADTYPTRRWRKDNKIPRW